MESREKQIERHRLTSAVGEYFRGWSFAELTTEDLKTIDALIALRTKQWKEGVKCT